MNAHNDVVGHAGIYLRNATLDALPVKIGGVGGVATRLDCRRQGIASEMMGETVREMRDAHLVDFGLCFANRGTRRYTNGLDGAFSKERSLSNSLERDACASASLTPSSLLSKLRRVREYSICADYRGEKAARALGIRL